MQTTHTQWILGIVAVIVIGGLFFWSSQSRTTPAVKNNDGTDTPTTPVAVDPNPTPTTPTTPNTASAYKDGTYLATGTYAAPSGEEHVDVSVTLSNGIITSATVTNKAVHSTSIKMQDRFIAGFSPLVIGKSIDSVQLSAVSGASLTPKGFNDAIAQIKVQAM